jgi:Tol biopolymer transport system component
MFAKPPDPYFGYGGPAFSPDGKRIAYVSKRNGRSFDVAVQQIGSERPQLLTSDERVLYDLTWAPDGRSILFCSNRSGVAALWRVPSGGGPPERVVGIGENATHPAVALQGGRLAYVQDINDTNIWRAALDENHRAHDPARIIASSRNDNNAQYSPDVKRIAFISERSGSPEIWLADADGGNTRQITSFGGPFVTDLRFSPDGREIAFDMPVNGYRQIFVMAADGGPPRRMTNEPAINHFYPAWSRDGKWIYYHDSAERPIRIARIPSGGGPKVRIGGDGGTLGLESLDGKFLYYSKRPQPSALWRMALPAGVETQIDANVVERGWDLASDGIYILRNKGRVEFLSFATGKVAPAAEGLGDEHNDVHEISVSPDGRWLLYTRHDRLESTIQVVEGFR